MNTITENIIKILKIQYELNINNIHLTNPNGGLNKIMINDMNDDNDTIMETINELHEKPINDKNPITPDELYAINENMDGIMDDLDDIITDINDDDLLITDEYKNKLLNEYNGNDELPTIYTDNLYKTGINLYEKNIIKLQLTMKKNLINNIQYIINKKYNK
jgi:hypothetical protein